MKELLHISHPDSVGCIQMTEVINKLIKENPEIKYIKIGTDSDPELYQYYFKKYNLPAVFPIFLGLVDGVMQDGHIGTAPELILKSLVS
jgi:hypothetical protein